MSTAMTTPQAEGWSAVVEAIGILAISLGRRGVEILSSVEGRSQNGFARLTLLARDRGIFTMLLGERPNVVACHWSLANGNDWWCQYTIEDDGSWRGPFAPRAASLHLTSTDDIARHLVDSWLTAVIPHH